ncbi:MAG: tetratricopeptide repeat protein [Woeseiaceae bacterium]
MITIIIIASFSARAEQGAEEYFAAGEWVAAADAYAQRTVADPMDTTAWFRLAVSARHSERFSVARDALDRAEKLQFSPLRIGFERARLDVLAGDNTGAMTELRAIADSGFTGVNVITSDPVLAALEGGTAYDALVAEMSKQAFPCEHDAAFAEFDFWLGEWDVHVANGTYAGSNRIDRAERGCVLTENWSSASGSTGTSINYVDKISGEWVQIWNDASGNQINIRGGLTDEGMLLVGTIHYVANNTTAAFRGLWSPMPDGRVRQFFEQASADGKSWSTWFEGFYSKKVGN